VYIRLRKRIFSKLSSHPHSCLHPLVDRLSNISYLAGNGKLEGLSAIKIAVLRSLMDILIKGTIGKRIGFASAQALLIHSVMCCKYTDLDAQLSFDSFPPVFIAVQDIQTSSIYSRNSSQGNLPIPELPLQKNSHISGGVRTNRTNVGNRGVGNLRLIRLVGLGLAIRVFTFSSSR